MEDESYLEPLPNWAIGRAEGDYTLTNASLPTKDGRCTGNAINLGEVESKRAFPTFLVATEAGNLMRLTKGENDADQHYGLSDSEELIEPWKPSNRTIDEDHIECKLTVGDLRIAKELFSDLRSGREQKT